MNPINKLFEKCCVFNDNAHDVCSNHCSLKSGITKFMDFTYTESSVW